MPVARRRGIGWETLALALPGSAKASLKPAPFTPQLAVLGGQPPAGDTWMHEIKWDGYRVVTTVVEGAVDLWSRNGLRWTGKIPTIAKAIEGLGVTFAALDGELIAGQGTRDDFGLLQKTLSGEKRGELSLVLFDLLHVDGVSVEDAPLLNRKELLRELLGPRSRRSLAYSSHVVGDGAAAFAMAEMRGFEGIISKRIARPYVHGRGDDWRKTKVENTEEFAVVGFTPPKGSRTGFGSLLVARPIGRAGWEYAGRVGTGFSNELIRSLTADLVGGGPTPTVSGEIDRDTLKFATWFPPRFVAEVIVRGYGTSGVLRQPSLKAVRRDKSPKDLRSSDRKMKP